eukprot:COSAG01_NODE_14321_length_1468_cov_130.582177_3_plen_110_part_00
MRDGRLIDWLFLGGDGACSSDVLMSELAGREVRSAEAGWEEKQRVLDERTAELRLRETEVELEARRLQQQQQTLPPPVSVGPTAGASVATEEMLAAMSKREVRLLELEQ